MSCPTSDISAEVCVRPDCPWHQDKRLMISEASARPVGYFVQPSVPLSLPTHDCRFSCRTELMHQVASCASPVPAIYLMTCSQALGTTPSIQHHTYSRLAGMWSCLLTLRSDRSGSADCDNKNLKLSTALLLMANCNAVRPCRRGQQQFSRSEHNLQCSNHRQQSFEPRFSTESHLMILGIQVYYLMSQQVHHV